MYNSHLLIKKKKKFQVTYLDFFFSLNRKQFSDVYMLSKATKSV